MNEQYTINFIGVSTAQAGRYAENLKHAIQNIDPNLQVERKRARNDTQDLGASLLLVLGTASASAIAKGIARWIAKNGGARIEISANGTVVASNLESGDAAKIAAAFSPRNK